jgi:hypothetical protein
VGPAIGQGAKAEHSQKAFVNGQKPRFALLLPQCLVLRLAGDFDTQAHTSNRFHSYRFQLFQLKVRLQLARLRKGCVQLSLTDLGMLALHNTGFASYSSDANQADLNHGLPYESCVAEIKWSAEQTSPWFWLKHHQLPQNNKGWALSGEGIITHKGVSTELKVL